jgi:hypothetical protein
VRASPIVMRHPLGQGFPQMPLMEWNEVVETFATCCPDQSFAKRVRLRDAGRYLQDGYVSVIPN